MFDALRNKITERRQRLDELTRECVVIEAEVRAYEDAMALVMAEAPARFPPPPPLPHITPARRRMAANWTAALAPFADEPVKPFSIDDVIASASLVGFTPTRGNVRSQMAAFVQRGRAERVSDGFFRLTEIGITDVKLLGLTGDAISEESAADTEEEPAA